MMRWLLIALTVPALLLGCEKHEAKPQARPPAEVTVLEIVPRDTPVSFEYVGQTESTRQVQIRARVDGFLDRRIYTEGSLVKAGDVMFQQDPKPFQATLDAALGALGEQQARLQTANDNLARVKPLTAQKALSQKDLDDAVGPAAGGCRGGQLGQGQRGAGPAQPGLHHHHHPGDGALQLRPGAGRVSYVSGANSLLTYVAQIDTIWVNFSVSENDLLRLRTEKVAGLLRMPAQDQFLVDVILADGSVFPHQGRITFANADYNVKTGTYLLRATIPNPDAVLRPGQFVRVRVSGAVRPNAILVPQEAVLLQGAKGHFVVALDPEDKAEVRPVQVGPWDHNDWYILGGLKAGDRVVTDGVVHLTPGAKAKVVKTLDGPSAPAVPPVAPPSTK